MQVTKHAKERLKERCGLNDKSSERMAKIAYEKGLRHGDLTGNLKKWVDKQYMFLRSQLPYSNQNLLKLNVTMDIVAYVTWRIIGYQ